MARYTARECNPQIEPGLWIVEDAERDGDVVFNGSKGRCEDWAWRRNYEALTGQPAS